MLRGPFDGNGTGISSFRQVNNLKIAGKHFGQGTCALVVMILEQRLTHSPDFVASRSDQGPSEAEMGVLGA